MNGIPKATICNWCEYQHYKKRNPPWFKLHLTLVRSDDWMIWDDASRLLAIVCMMLACRTKDGTFPLDPRLAKRYGCLDQDPDFGPLIESGFLVVEDDYKPQKLQKPAKKEKLDLSAWFDEWNAMAASAGLPQCQKVTDKRHTAARARHAEHGESAMMKVLDLVSESDFLKGLTGSESWTGATVDWVLNKSNFVKILEGNYKNNGKSKPRGPSTNVPDAHTRADDYDLF